MALAKGLSRKTVRKHSWFPLALALASVSTPSYGATPSVVGLRYRAFEGCPGREAFVAGLQQRVPGVQFAEAGQGTVQYEVSLEKAEGEVLGRLKIRGGQEAWDREVTGDSCAGAAAALSFIAGFSLGAAPAAEEPPPPPPRAPETAPKAPEAPSPAALWSIGADGAATTAVAPRLAWGAEAHAEVQLPVSFGPSLRLAGGVVASGSTDTPPGTVAFRLVRARIEACPVSGELGPLWLSPCVGYEIGSLRAAGGGVDLPATEARSWSALRLQGRARWPADAPWFAEVEGGLVLPFTSRTFLFDNPRAEVFSTPRVGGSAGVGLGWRFL